MFARSIGLLGTFLVVASGVARAQAPQGDAVQSVSETTRTSETNPRDDTFEHLGWELAAGDEGVRVERIITDSPIAAAHLEENDIIKSIGGENVLTAERVREVLKEVADTGESTTEIVVVRDGKELSYLLPLESLTTDGSRTTQTTTRTNQTDLVQMIEQLQTESRQQQALLQTLLTEVQSLREQLGVTPDAQINNTVVSPAGTLGTGNSVAPPRGVAPNAAGRSTPRPRTNSGPTTPNRP